MEYGEAISKEAAELAFRIAVHLRAEGEDDLDEIATRAVAGAYCTCVTDGEDAAEYRLSRIHSALVAELKRRLAKHSAAKENS